jgi:predicted nucleic acid-binding protein
MRILLDTNVVLDVLLERLPWHVEAEAIVAAARKSQFTAAVTSLSIATVFYVARRHAGLRKARLAVRYCLDAFDIVTVDRSILESADLLPGSDFEDNIQIAGAAAAGVDAIITRNPADFAASPVPVLAPQQLLAQLASLPEA